MNVMQTRGLLQGVAARIRGRGPRAARRWDRRRGRPPTWPGNLQRDREPPCRPIPIKGRRPRGAMVHFHDVVRFASQDQLAVGRGACDSWHL